MIKKRILIDGRFIGVGESMTRYCLEIVQRILELDKENDFTLLIRPAGESVIQRSKIKDQNLPAGRHGDNLKIKVLNIAHYSIGEQTELLKYLNKEKFDLVHFIQFNHPIRYKGKFVVTVHDLTLFGHLHRQKLYKRIAFGTVMKSAVKNSTKIITISEISKKDIIENYRVDPNKIIVTYLAVDDRFNPKLKSQKQKIIDFKEKYGIGGDYILYTGMWKKHKNLIRMLKAYEKLIKIGSNYTDGHGRNTEVSSLEGKGLKSKFIQLVLVGKVDREEKEVIELIDKINNRITNNELRIKEDENYNSSFLIHNSNLLLPIVTTGFIEEEELPIAYAGSLFYVIPSLSEGFGLPPLEAMACGTPVISSNVSAMPEILGSAALYFDPYNVDDIAEKMEMLTTNENLRQELSEKGLKQAAKYSWNDTAKETLKIYRELIK